LVFFFFTASKTDGHSK